MSIPTTGLLVVKLYSPAFGVRLSVAGVVRPAAVMTAVDGTTDIVSVCDRRNIVGQETRKCHGIVFIVRLSMWVHSRSMFIMYQHRTFFSFLQDLGDDSVLEPSFTSVQSPGSVFNPDNVSSPQSGVLSGSSHQRSVKRSSRGSHIPQPGRNQNDKLHFLVVNANSVKGKVVALEHISNYTRPTSWSCQRPN